MVYRRNTLDRYMFAAACVLMLQVNHRTLLAVKDRAHQWAELQACGYKQKAEIIACVTKSLHKIIHIETILSFTWLEYEAAFIVVLTCCAVCCFTFLSSHLVSLSYDSTQNLLALRTFNECTLFGAFSIQVSSNFITTLAFFAN